MNRSTIGGVRHADREDVLLPSDGEVLASGDKSPFSTSRIESYVVEMRE